MLTADEARKMADEATAKRPIDAYIFWIVEQVKETASKGGRSILFSDLWKRMSMNPPDHEQWMRIRESLIAAGFNVKPFPVDSGDGADPPYHSMSW